MKRLIMFVGFILVLLLNVISSEAAVSYILRVQNQQVVGSSLFFDVYIQSNSDDSLRLANCDVYLDFNDQYFTSDAAALVDYNTAFDFYPLDVSIDGNSRIVVNTGTPAFNATNFLSHTVLVSTSSPGTYICRVEVTTISNSSGTSGLSWYYLGTTGTDIHYYKDWESPYAERSVDSDGDIPPGDMSLPVEMSNVTAEASKEEGITITWRTESELNSAGFQVWRSLSEDKAYNKITSALIPSQGNTSVAQEYSYCDKNVESNVLYWYKIEEISTDGKSKFFGPISVVGMKPIPTEYDLAQNYPNPFNPETMIEFQLPENADVSIVVYSLLGREIKTLVKEKMQAGYHEITWTGKDSHGVKVPSGMYIVQMRAGDFRQIRKMTIIR